MEYIIEIAPKAARQLKKLPTRVRVRIGAKIDGLGRDPRPTQAIKLSGGSDFYRLRAGEYRIIYQVRDDVLVVLVVAIGHRGDIYERLRR